MKPILSYKKEALEYGKWDIRLDGENCSLKNDNGDDSWIKPVIHFKPGKKYEVRVFRGEVSEDAFGEGELFGFYTAKIYGRSEGKKSFHDDGITMCFEADAVRAHKIKDDEVMTLAVFSIK